MRPGAQNPVWSAMITRANDSGVDRVVLWVHVVALAGMSLFFESLFIHTGINLLDEGWILYAAKQLLDGGTLYDEVFFVFPPGHLLPAVISYAVDPPGIVFSRWIYAAFNVALCVALYLLGRRFMKPAYAFIGVFLLAIHTPWSHGAHFLFGYRYLVFSILALLALSRRVTTGDGRWLLLAGFWAGIALDFRLTPAFAVSVGIGFGILAASREWRDWLRDGGWYTLGILLAAAPVYGWVMSNVGATTLWSEVVVRPVEMTEDQALSAPALFIPWPITREQVGYALVAWTFRVVPVVYLVYLVALAVLWFRDYRAGKACQRPLFVAFVVFGAIYLSRGFGRADQGHLDSAIPPFLLLIGHMLFMAERWLAARMPHRRAAGVTLTTGAVLVVLSLVSQRGDQWILGEVGGRFPFVSTGGRILRGIPHLDKVDPSVAMIRRWSRPGDTVLDLSSSPLLLVLSERDGPGYADIVMPGTFRNEEEELRFVERLDADPPILLLEPTQPFDGRPENALALASPHFSAWIEKNYRRTARNQFLIARPHRELGRRPAAWKPKGNPAPAIPRAP